MKQAAEQRVDGRCDRSWRVLFIIDHLVAPGGTENHLLHLVRGLIRSGFDVAVIALAIRPNSVIDDLVAAGAEFRHFPVARWYTPRAFVQGLRILRYMRSRRFDLVQTYHYKSDVYGATIASLAGVGCIVSSKRDSGDLKTPFRFAMHRLVRPLVDRYIAVSKAVEGVIVRREHVAPERITLLYNGVDTTRFAGRDESRTAAAREALGLSPGDTVIGMVAAFRPEKDHKLLIDAFARLLPEWATLKLVLVGQGGPFWGECRDYVRDRGLQSHVLFTGPSGQVESMLAAFDIACLVPRSNEGFSNAVIEAMAMALPLVVTRIGGNAEAVIDGETGYVVEPGDLDALVDRLGALLGDPSARRVMGERARRRVVETFSLPAMLERHVELYESLLGDTSAAHEPPR
ncbi:MAG: glycosyltransferase [Gammaproteobacteria bacterium]|nr:glycosyltransferase [Gammaproteobacteria bacterium]